MASETSDANKVELLFKEFTGVVNAKQQNPFSVESFAFKDYILNNNILSEDIPQSLPAEWRANALDASANIPDNSFIHLTAIGYPQLTFHKKRDLSAATFGSLKTWYISDGSGGSQLKNAISFKNDPVNNSYNYSVYQKISPTIYSPVNMYTNPTFWLFDFKSGFLEFYGDETVLNGTGGVGSIDLQTYPPVISFFQYTGSTGGGGGGGGDASYNNLDVSNNLYLQGNNLMQSVTIEPWVSPIQPPPQIPALPLHTQDYVIATVDHSGNVANAIGLFTLQLGEPYLQNIVFHAGAMNNKQPFIKILSNTNQEIINNIGFSDIKIIDYDGVFYLTTTFIPGSGIEPAILKIILVNNNANKDISPSRDWILRSDPDTDWYKDGPQIPEIKMPWYPGSLPNALTAILLTQNNGEPCGVSSQPEYFQNDIVLVGANILAGENGTGTVDICGNLYVDRDASFNMGVHVRSSVDISGGLAVDLSGTFGGDLFAANTPMIEYIRYDNNNFLSSNHPTGAWQTIANIHPITAQSTGMDTRAAYAIFEIVDRSNNGTKYRFQDNITCMISYTGFSSSSTECNLTILSSNPVGNTSVNIGYIGNIRLRHGEDNFFPGANVAAANLQIKRFCDATTGTTDVRVRMYHNFQPILPDKEFTPFVLTSDSLALTSIKNTEFDVLTYATGFISSTKRHYVDKSTMGSLNMEGDISMGTHNITEVNVLSVGNTGEFPRIKLDATTGLELIVNENAGLNHKITLGDDATTSKQIYMRVNPVATLDMNYVGIIKVSEITSDQNIDIIANNIILGNDSILIDLSATNIDVSNNLSATNIDISNDLNVGGLITGEADTTFVEYRNFSTDIPANSGPAWYCIATCEGTQDNARGLFIIDDDTSGIREQTIFYAGTSYARGNYINVIAHNWYGQLTTNLRIDINSTYTGANLYLYRGNTPITITSDINIRLYENGRTANTGGRWVLTSTAIAGLNTVAVNLDISYDPNSNRANSASSLDHTSTGNTVLNNLDVAGQLLGPIKLFETTAANLSSGINDISFNDIAVVSDVGHSVTSQTEEGALPVIGFDMSGAGLSRHVMISETVYTLYTPSMLNGWTVHSGGTPSGPALGIMTFSDACDGAWMGLSPLDGFDPTVGSGLANEMRLHRDSWFTGCFWNSILGPYLFKCFGSATVELSMRGVVFKTYTSPGAHNIIDMESKDWIFCPAYSTTFHNTTSMKFTFNIPAGTGNYIEVPADGSLGNPATGTKAYVYMASFPKL